MFDPISAYLFGQAIKLLSVPAGAAWKQFAEQLGSQAGGAAADSVTTWLLHGGEAGGLNARDIAEMDSNAGAAEALGKGLEKQLGVQLTPTGSPSGTYEGGDAAIVAGYEALLWRVAALAYMEDRPIAVDGALQGAEWLTVCVPTPGFLQKPHTLPDPGKLWSRSDSPPRLDRIDFAVAEFWVKRTPLDHLVKERDDLNMEFRRKEKGTFPFDESGTPLLERWHRLDGFEATWVLLEPDVAASVHIITGGKDQADIRLRLYGIGDYPAEWRPLLEISNPDDLAGLKALGEGADRFSAASRAVADRVKAALKSQQSP